MLSPEERVGGVRIIIFRLLGGLKRHHCVGKYDLRYHEIAQNFIQMILECRQMI